MSSAFDSLRETVMDGAVRGPGSETVYVRESDALPWDGVPALVEHAELESYEDTSHREYVVLVSRSDVPAISRAAWIKIRGKTYRVESIDASNPASWSLVCAQ